MRTFRIVFGISVLLGGSALAGAQAPAGAPSAAAVIAPSDNLVVENVPPIPASLAAEVGRYTEFRGAGFSSWHPTRHEMLIGTRFGNVTQAHLVKFPGGARTQMTFYPDRVSGARFDPVKGDSFIFSKDEGGNEFFQFYRYDFADGKTTLITDGKSRNTDAKWSHNGKLVAYGSTRRTGDDVDVYVVDPRDPKSDRRLLELSGGGWQVDDWSPDDSKLLLTEAISVNETYLWLADVAAGTKTPLTPKGKDKVAYNNAAFAKDGKGLYVTVDQGSEFQRLAYMDLATKKVEFLSPDTADVDDFDLTEDGKTIAYVTNEKGASALHLLDTASRQSRPGPKLPLGVISGLRWHKDDSLLGVHDGDGALELRRVLLRAGDRQGRALDVQRARRPEPGQLRRARARVLEDVRRPRDLRVPLQARSEEVLRQAARLRLHPRRPGGSVPSRLSWARGTTSSTSSASRCSCRTCAARSGTARRSRSSTTGSCARARTRTSARCSTGSPRGRTSTRTGSWSAAAATAAT